MESTPLRQREARTEIAAPPARVYALLADVARMGEWSPECRGGRWLAGAREPAVGARFKAANRRGILRWRTVCRIIAAEPGRELAWEVLPAGLPATTRWRYLLEASEQGTRVTERFELVRYARWQALTMRLAFGGLERRLDELERSMEATLGALKAVVETGPSTDATSR